MPKRTYSVTEYFPVYKDVHYSNRTSDREVSFTTCRRHNHTSPVLARLHWAFLTLLDKLFAPANFSRYYKVQFQKHSLYGYENSDFGPAYEDSGPWRSYSLDTAGDTLKELLDNAVIEEVGQSGGTIDCYGLGHGSHITELAREQIENYYYKESTK